MMNAIFSGVHSEAATNRSPSFSRSSSSVTTTISPCAKAAIAASTRLLSVGHCWSQAVGLCGQVGAARRALADLTAMAQIVIGQHACQHGFADRHRADADARIVAALGRDLGVAAVFVDGLARVQDRRRRLDRKARHDRLAGGNAAENAAGMVGQKERLAVIAHAHLVGILFAAERRRGETVADLDALHRIDAHQRGGNVGIELAVNRRAEARRHAFRHHLDHRADRRAGLAHAVEITPHRLRLLGVRTEERIVADLVPVPAAAIDLVRAHLHQRGAHDHARARSCARWRRPRRAPRSRAPRRGRRRDNRARRI